MSSTDSDSSSDEELRPPSEDTKQADSTDTDAPAAARRPEAFLPSAAASASKIPQGKQERDPGGSPPAPFAMGGMEAESTLSRQQQELLRASRMMTQQGQGDDLLSPARAKKSGQKDQARPTNMGSSATGPTGVGRVDLEQQVQALLRQNHEQQRLLQAHGLLPPQGGNPFVAAGASMMGSPELGMASPGDIVGKSMAVRKYYDDTPSDEPPPHAQDPADEEGDEEDDSSDGNKKKGSYGEGFPKKLYRMLEEVEQNDEADVVSFFHHGRAFVISKPRKFITDVMPKYFTTNRMSSFQRQLNLYGFRRITEGRDKGGYFHKFFLKGRKDLLSKIKRKKTSISKAFLEQRTREQLRLFGLDGTPQSQLMMIPPHLRQQGVNPLGHNLNPMMGGAFPPSFLPTGPAGLAGLPPGFPAAAAASNPGLDNAVSDAAAMLGLDGNSSVAAALLSRGQNRHPFMGQDNLAALQHLNAANGRRGPMHGLNQQNPLASRDPKELQLLLAQLQQQQQRRQPPPGGPPPF